MTSSLSFGRRCMIHKVITTDAEIDAAIAQSEFQHVHTAVKAWYDSDEDAIVVKLANGMSIGWPRKNLQGLRGARRAQLEDIEVPEPGTGLYWPQLGVSHYLPGLIDGVFGTKAWLATIGRVGGRRKSTVKAIQSRANGLLGGRPRTATAKKAAAKVAKKVAKKKCSLISVRKGKR